MDNNKFELMKFRNTRYIACCFFLFLFLTLPACGAGGESAAVLTCATLYPDKIDRGAVDRFNRRHTDVQIAVVDYSAEDSSNGKSGKDRLLTEMAAGRTPDILDLTGLSYQVMARKGYLEDLWPYIEGDPELGREGVWETPLRAAEIDGKLYEVFDCVCVDTLVGAESVVGNRTSWTLVELQETFAAMPEGSSILYPTSRNSDLLSYVFKMRLDSYVDWETGQCSFDSDSFRTALAFVGSVPSEPERPWTEEEIGEHILSGRQMLTQQILIRPVTVQALDASYGMGGRAAFVGYPVEDGGVGSSFYFTMQSSRMAMSSACRNKPAAWEFIRELLLPQYAGRSYERISVNQMLGIPINRSDYEWMIAADRSNAVRDQTKQFYGLPRVKLHPATEEEITRYEDFVNQINRIQIYDDVIYNIVQELSGPYFAGDKTLDETVDLIQRRVQLYVNETR